MHSTQNGFNTLPPHKNERFIISATSATQSCNSQVMPLMLNIARTRPYCHSCYACTNGHIGCTPSERSYRLTNVIKLHLVHAQTSHVVSVLGMGAQYRQQQQDPIYTLFVKTCHFNHLRLHFFSGTNQAKCIWATYPLLYMDRSWLLICQVLRQ